jgi:hypothetical protein
MIICLECGKRHWFISSLWQYNGKSDWNESNEVWAGESLMAWQKEQGNNERHVITHAELITHEEYEQWKGKF